MDALFIFVTTTIPKAGAQVGPLPLTLNLVLFSLIVLRSPGRALEALRKFNGYWCCYILLLVVGILGTLVAIGEGLESFELAQRVVVMFSPLAVVSAFRVEPELGVRIVALAVILVSAYALVEFVGGISETAIRGVTYAFGQSLEDKPIGYDGLSDSAKKMPSTFQNGNSLGIFCVLGLALLMAWNPSESGRRMLRRLSIGSGVVGLLLCGSRSILIPASVLGVSMLNPLLRSLSDRARNSACALIASGILIAWGYLSLSENRILGAFWRRVVVETVNDPTAAGRTGQWAEMWSGISALSGWEITRLLLIGKNPSWGLGGEGLPAFFTTFGLLATVAFYVGIVLVARHLWTCPETRPVSIAVLCTVFAFAVDTSYFYPPNLMILFIISGLALQIGEDKRTIRTEPVSSGMSLKTSDLRWHREDSRLLVARPGHSIVGARFRSRLFYQRLW